MLSIALLEGDVSCGTMELGLFVLENRHLFDQYFEDNDRKLSPVHELLGISTDSDS
jgi:hypothetical protein